MNRARGGAGQAPPNAPSVAGAEVRPTLLLPLLLERFDPEQPLTVLDVGFGNAATVDFFSRFRCRLHFAGLIEAEELAALPAEELEEYFDRVLPELLRFPADTSFDICLLWDFLDYLPVAGMEAFSRALSPYLHRQTHGHGFGRFKANAPAMARGAPETALHYGVYDVDKLLVQPRATGSAATYSHSRAVLAESLTCFEIVRGTLLKEGTMELLLQAR